MDNKALSPQILHPSFHFIQSFKRLPADLRAQFEQLCGTAVRIDKVNKAEIAVRNPPRDVGMKTGSI